VIAMSEVRDPKSYPWQGEFELGDQNSPVALVHLAERVEPPKELYAIRGPLRTENLGIEKVIANVISNPNIRILVIFGKEIRGHWAGNSLIKLHEGGIDEKGRINGAPGAIPYIENLDDEALVRFQEQVEIIDMLEITDGEELIQRLRDLNSREWTPFGEPYIAVRIEKKVLERPLLSDMIGLHHKIFISVYGDIEEAK